MSKRSKKKLKIIILLIVIIALFLFWQNNGIVINRIQITSNKIPDDFEGYKILQISDLHSKEFGKNQKWIVKKVRKEEPDIIFVTGDAIDSKKYNEDVCIQLFAQIIKVAPIYLVTGNHEAWSNRFDEFEKRLVDVGVIVLRNDSKLISIKDSSILIAGIDDPDFGEYSNIKAQIDDTVAGLDGYYKILLSHRPEMMNIYVESNIDVVFAGHAHGGQVRLPFIGGIVSPNQGWFPQYTSGDYHKNNTTMIVSRGLGNSIIPQRILNLPELIVATLSSK
ncbi:MAG: phosphoesterase [Firmicutes bacterium HGW-Firmicutes-7]|nr:MAG: phosphoesterase [Firmicutes bacterium HGW-Firmicutes-7]